MSSIKIPKAALELWRFASRDESRSNLGVVRFEFCHASRRATGIATDGHRMTVLTWQWDEDSLPGSGHIHIPGSTLKGACKFAGRFKGELALVLEYGESKEANFYAHGTIPMPILIDHEVNFPDWQEVMPKEAPSKELGEPVALNPAYLEEALAHARKWVLPKPARRGTGDSYRFGLHTAVFELNFWSPNNPAKITARDPVNQVDATYIVMPMRL